MLELTNRNSTWAICDACGGNGCRENPAFSNGFTSDEWAEWDGDERESYLAGTYDVPCTDCRGSGKVRQPIVASLSFAEKRQLVLDRREVPAGNWMNDPESIAERRMGA